MAVTAPPPPQQLRFGGLDISYDARVLEPRSWTLMQSEWAAEAAAGLPDGPLLELCAGAGHIGLVAATLAGRPLVQVEADAVAADWARANAAAAGVDADVRCCRLEAAIGADERFWVIVADPPYLPSAEVADWPDDPVTAIDGGADGLDVTRAVLDVLAVHLHPGGVALLQVAGAAQAATVAEEAALRGCLRPGAVRAHDDRRAVIQLHRVAS